MGSRAVSALWRTAAEGRESARLDMLTAAASPLGRSGPGGYQSSLIYAIALRFGPAGSARVSYAAYRAAYFDTMQREFEEREP